MEIETGVKMPENKRRGGRSVYVDTIVAMQPGQSVHVESIREARGMRNSARRLGYEMYYASETLCDSSYDTGYRVKMVGPR